MTSEMKIPITMCHGIRHDGEKPLTEEHLDRLVGIARELNFESITYDDLDGWYRNESSIPERPIMFDFDHPVKSIRHSVHDVLQRYGYTGNLFIYTRPYDVTYPRNLPWDVDEHMTWDEIGELRQAGWHLGAHTVSHPNLSDLSIEDPTGETLRVELDRCNEIIQKSLGYVPKDFAFTGTSWSSIAAEEVKKRYRFGRLWIVGSEYRADGKSIRYADLVGITGADEADGGPPHAARYITKNSDPYRLPSMEIQALIHDPEAFRHYLDGALV